MQDVRNYFDYVNVLLNETDLGFFPVIIRLHSEIV
jgi:hypothetical protein